MNNLGTQELSKRGFALHNTRLRRYGYKAWEIQRLYYSKEKNTFTDWHKGFDALGNLPTALQTLGEGTGGPFTAKEAVYLLDTYKNAAGALVPLLRGKSIAVCEHRLRTGIKNEWYIDKYRQKSNQWHTIKYPMRWQIGFMGMLDICIAQDDELIVYHADELANHIEEAIEKMQGASVN